MNIGMRRQVLESIRLNSDSISPQLSQRNSAIHIRKQRMVGLNITYSPRFVCSINKADHEGETDCIFVKCKHDVHKEYENMQMLWDRHYCHSLKYLIPKPLFLDKNNSFLFLQYVRGRSLLDGFYGKFESRSAKLKVLHSRVARAAHWLVDFQNISPCDIRHRIPNEMADLESNVDHLAGLTAEEKDRVIAKMRRVMNGFPEYVDTLVTSHFLPRNLMFVDDDTKVCGVDFPKLRYGWPYYDFLTFVLGIEKLELYPLISRDDCQDLKQTFIVEYATKTKIACDPAAMEHLWAAYVIADLRRRYQRNVIRLKGFGNGIFAAKTLKRLIDWSRK